MGNYNLYVWTAVSVTVSILFVQMSLALWSLWGQVSIFDKKSCQKSGLDPIWSCQKTRLDTVGLAEPSLENTLLSKNET